MPENENQVLLVQKMAEKNNESPYDYVFGSQDKFDVDALVLIIASEVEAEMVDQGDADDKFFNGEIFKE